MDQALRDCREFCGRLRLGPSGNLTSPSPRRGSGCRLLPRRGGSTGRSLHRGPHRRRRSPHPLSRLVRRRPSLPDRRLSLHHPLAPPTWRAIRREGHDYPRRARSRSVLTRVQKTGGPSRCRPAVLAVNRPRPAPPVVSRTCRPSPLARRRTRIICAGSLTSGPRRPLGAVWSIRAESSSSERSRRRRRPASASLRTTSTRYAGSARAPGLAIPTKVLRSRFLTERLRAAVPPQYRKVPGGLRAASAPTPKAWECP